MGVVGGEGKKPLLYEEFNPWPPNSQEPNFQLSLFSGVKAHFAGHSFHSFEQKSCVCTNTEYLFPGEKKWFFFMQTVTSVIEPRRWLGCEVSNAVARYSQQWFWGHVKRNEVWNCVCNLLPEGFEIRVFPAVYTAVSFPEVYIYIICAAVEVIVAICQEMHLNKN